MKESNINSKHSLSHNNLNLAVSKSSIRTINKIEQSDLDRDINDILLSEFGNMNEIKEKNNESGINLTNSALKQIFEEPTQNSEKLEEISNELDLEGFDFSEILKSQIKHKSPKITNIKTMPFQIEKLKTQASEITEKIQIHSIQNNFELNEDDLKNLYYESILPKKNISEKKPASFPTLEKNKTCFQIIHQASSEIHNPIKLLSNIAQPNNKTTSINQGSSFSFLNENPSNSSLQQEYANMIQSQMKFYESFIRKIQEIEILKIQNQKAVTSVEYLLNQNNNTGNFQNKSNPVLSNFNQYDNNKIQAESIFNNNKVYREIGTELKLFTNQIKIYVTPEDQKYPKVNRSEINNNNLFTHDDVDFMNFNQPKIQTFCEKPNVNQKNYANYNSQNTLAYDITRSGYNNSQINKSSTYSCATDFRQINNNKERALNDPREKSFQKNRELNTNTKNEELFTSFGYDDSIKTKINNKKQFMKIKDDEFDQILNNHNNKNNASRESNYFDNPFVSGNNITIQSDVNKINNLPNNTESLLEIEEKDLNINENVDLKNLNDDEFDQFLLQAKQTNNPKSELKGGKNLNQIIPTNKLIHHIPTPDVDTNKLKNKIDIKKIKEEEINPRDIKDDEFDSLMMNIKNKMLKPSGFKNEFMKGNDFTSMNGGNKTNKINNSTNLESASTLVNQESFKSDFMCNNNHLSYKPNQRTLKLMMEMEKETGEDLCEIKDDVNPKISEKIKKFVKNGKLETKLNPIENKNNNVEQFIKPEIGVKRNYNEHMKNLIDNSSKDPCSIEISKRKTKKFGQGFKIDKGDNLNKKKKSNNIDSNKPTTQKLGNSTVDISEQPSKEEINSITKNTKIENDNKELSISKNTDKSKRIPENSSKISFNPLDFPNSEFLCTCKEKITEKLESPREHAEMEILKNCFEQTCKICKGKKQLP